MSFCVDYEALYDENSLYARKDVEITMDRRRKIQTNRREEERKEGMKEEWEEGWKEGRERKKEDLR